MRTVFQQMSAVAACHTAGGLPAEQARRRLLPPLPPRRLRVGEPGLEQEQTFEGPQSAEAQGRCGPVRLPV